MNQRKNDILVSRCVKRHYLWALIAICGYDIFRWDRCLYFCSHLPHPFPSESSISPHKTSALFHVNRGRFENWSLHGFHSFRSSLMLFWIYVQFRPIKSNFDFHWNFIRFLLQSSQICNGLFKVPIISVWMQSVSFLVESALETWILRSVAYTAGRRKSWKQLWYPAVSSYKHAFSLCPVFSKVKSFSITHYLSIAVVCRCFRNSLKCNEL